MGSGIELSWPTGPSAELTTVVHGLVTAVEEAGGATPWPGTPTFASVHEWLHRLTSAVVQGDARLCLASVDGAPQAAAAWRRSAGIGRTAVARAELAAMLAHPAATDPDLTARLAAAAITSAKAAGVDILEVGVRAGDDDARARYTALGFVPAQAGGKAAPGAAGPAGGTRMLLQLSASVRG